MDDNKRTAITAAGIFLWINRYQLTVENEEMVRFTPACAQSQLSIDEMTNWFTHYSSPVVDRCQCDADMHPHICRHTVSVRFLMNGGDIFSLQKILGHTSLEMTRKYVNLASGDVKESPPLQPDG